MTLRQAVQIVLGPARQRGVKQTAVSANLTVC